MLYNGDGDELFSSVDWLGARLYSDQSESRFTGNILCLALPVCSHLSTWWCCCYLINHNLTISTKQIFLAPLDIICYSKVWEWSHRYLNRTNDTTTNINTYFFHLTYLWIYEYCVAIKLETCMPPSVYALAILKIQSKKKNSKKKSLTYFF